jgi:hypothetical protein
MIDVIPDCVAVFGIILYHRGGGGEDASGLGGGKPESGEKHCGDVSRKSTWLAEVYPESWRTYSSGVERNFGGGSQSISGSENNNYNYNSYCRFAL